MSNASECSFYIWFFRTEFTPSSVLFLNFITVPLFADFTSPETYGLARQ